MIFVFPFIKNLYSSLPSNCCACALLGPVGGVPEVSRLWWAPPGSEVGSPAVSPLPPCPGVYAAGVEAGRASPVALCDSPEAALPTQT